MAKPWTLPPMRTIPQVQPWARVLLWPFMAVAVVALLPFLVALLPIAGLIWLGAKR